MIDFVIVLCWGLIVLAGLLAMAKRDDAGQSVKDIERMVEVRG